MSPQKLTNDDAAARSATATLRQTKGPARLYVGTYTGSGSEGIYTLQIDRLSGALAVPEVAAKTANPTWLIVSPDKRRLYAVSGGDAAAAAYAVDRVSGRLTPASEAYLGDGKPPCHLAIDATAQLLIASHYHHGTVTTIPIQAGGNWPASHGGTLGSPTRVIEHSRLGHPTGPHPTRQDAPHVHSATISPDNRYAYICDLGLDRIYAYALDSEHATLSPAPSFYTATRPGAGPRHATFSRDGRLLLVVGELDSTLTTYTYNSETAALTLVDTQSLLPANFSGENTAAEVRIHPNGRWVYASNRGHDSIATFALDDTRGQLRLLGHTPSGGRSPRHFAICPCGGWLVTANQESNTLCAFAIDQTTGLPSSTPTSTVTVPKPVCVVFSE
ncbi:hypothetical protein AXK12_06575 [Cephaloticoccus capnophilus]|uniref:6-phosphogluconolactonase n=1 Tax=Cephaloticoccus capnophilus TaxID=1548208 RepID=A0A139SK25_9BACT|nr:lactonase family protein [Cephaloticoccus capnophilus]KXU34893.1 hypothetical protein AXK12_06575 [Cephaloticoccus capnophilus]